MSKFIDIIHVLRGRLSMKKQEEWKAAYHNSQCVITSMRGGYENQLRELQAKIAFLDPMSLVNRKKSDEIGNKILKDLVASTKQYCCWCNRETPHIKGVCIQCGTK